MTRVISNPPHAIVFLLDSTYGAVAIPEYVEGEPVAASASSISIVTKTQEESDVCIEVTKGGPSPEGLFPAFEGFVSSVGGELAIVQTGMERLLEVEVVPGQVPVSIWIDDLSFPAHIFVRVGKH